MVNVYESGDKFVLGVKGGQFKEFESEPKAIITENEPMPTKLWTMPEEEERDPFKGTFWRYNYEIREFLCDDELKYILRVVYIRDEPTHIYGDALFFIEAEYAKNKTEELRNRGMLAEYTWEASGRNWIEIERGFKYDDEDEEDDEEFQ